MLSKLVNRERKKKMKEKKKPSTLVNREKIIGKKKKKKANPLEVKSNVRGIFGILFHELSFLPILERIF